MPKIEYRLPEQRKDKASSPNMNINVNININNSFSPYSAMKVEINKNFFKKPFEYLSSCEYSSDNANYSLYVYNKDYLKSVDRISKIYQKDSQVLQQSPQIQLPNYTVMIDI